MCLTQDGISSWAVSGDFIADQGLLAVVSPDAGVHEAEALMDRGMAVIAVIQHCGEGCRYFGGQTRIGLPGTIAGQHIVHLRRNSETTVKKKYFGALAASLVLLSTSMIPTAALADEAGPQDDLTYSEYEIALSADGSWVDESGYIRISREELQSIGSTQTAVELAAVVNSGEPLNVLLDDDGEILAAAYAELVPQGPQARAITKCTSGGLKLHSHVGGGKQAIRCFGGSGTSTVTVTNVFYTTPGGMCSELFLSNEPIPSSTNIDPNTGYYFSHDVNVWKLRRFSC
ncbi:hypothetical protein J2D78_09145 [Microbacterium maritypicum]|uniref:hypothetical protein n=1 Tax=Microbacterium maritypicum TaxID=33918 RepID=UPI001B33AA55|nr:hypothetical protein [Microbacterium liquefaciens]MBP5802245.1 hypothetical protein [Microbacterium liquefaciens]